MEFSTLRGGIPLSSELRADNLPGQFSEWFRWRQQSQLLDLAPCHREVFLNVTRHAKQMGYDQPNLLNPRTFQDKISWLMLFDQTENKIALADKLGARRYISDTIGEEWCPPLLYVADEPKEADLHKLEPPYVVKANHDSGSVFTIQKNSQYEVRQAVSQLKSSLLREYGWAKGEWPYRFIERKVFAEKFIGRPKDLLGGAESIRFHCVNGRVSWMQLISPSAQGYQELITDREGVPLQLSLSTIAVKSRKRRLPDGWEELRELAEELAADFRYVRIDSLHGPDRNYIGEFTFFPLAGLIRRESNLAFGEMMKFATHRESRFPPISCRRLALSDQFSRL